jgi:ribonuclease-3
LERVLGYKFGDPELLERALTHRGALGSGRKTGTPVAASAGNERLEFLGDRVLGLVVADLLLRTFPDEAEGGIATRYAALVSAPVLAKVATAIGLKDHLNVAPAQKKDSANTAVLADACEAVIGALFCDGGLPAAEHFISAHWPTLMHAEIVPPKDAKTALQEWAQARGLPLPVYKVVDASGPAHAPSFVMAVTVEGHPETRGAGRTKRLATQAAAIALLAALRHANGE